MTLKKTEALPDTPSITVDGSDLSSGRVAHLSFADEMLSTNTSPGRGTALSSPSPIVSFSSGTTMPSTTQLRPPRPGTAEPASQAATGGVDMSGRRATGAQTDMKIGRYKKSREERAFKTVEDGIGGGGGGGDILIYCLS